MRSSSIKEAQKLFIRAELEDKKLRVKLHLGHTLRSYAKIKAVGVLTPPSPYWTLGTWTKPPLMRCYC